MNYQISNFKTLLIRLFIKTVFAALWVTVFSPTHLSSPLHSLFLHSLFLHSHIREFWRILMWKFDQTHFPNRQFVNVFIHLQEIFKTCWVCFWMSEIFRKYSLIFSHRRCFKIHFNKWRNFWEDYSSSFWFWLNKHDLYLNKESTFNFSWFVCWLLLQAVI